MKRHAVFLLSLGSAALMACSGGPDSARDADPSTTSATEMVAAYDDENLHEVVITMSEYQFDSSDSIFTAGVPYRFVFHNKGLEAHEWAVVPRGARDESDLLFEVEDDELGPGATVVRVFTFPEPGEYDFACYLPGHYEGGMVMPIRVVAAE